MYINVTIFQEDCTNHMNGASTLEKQENEIRHFQLLHNVYQYRIKGNLLFNLGNLIYFLPRIMVGFIFNSTLKMF